MNRNPWEIALEAMDWDQSDSEPTRPEPRNPRRPPPVPIKSRGQGTGRRPLPGVSTRSNEAFEDFENRVWNVRNRKTGQVFTHIAGRTPMDAKKQLLATNPLLRGISPLDLEADPMGDGGTTTPGDDPAPAPSSQSFTEPSRGSRFTKNAPIGSDDDDITTKRQVNAPAPMPTTQMRKPKPPVKREASGAGAMGANAPVSGEPNPVREAIKDIVREIVRKKAGGGGYALYAPNKGKKKNPKPVGEFPTRLAAKNAELARFPPKDPEQLKKMRARLDKIKKDPKKRAAAEKQDLSGRKRIKKSGAPAGDRKKRRESFVRLISQDLSEGLFGGANKPVTERLFHEDEVPGSPWDEKMSALHPDAISSDRKLHTLHRGMEKACIGALGDAHKSLSKVLKGIVKVNSGDISFDDDRKKTFMPVMLDCDGMEIGPVHLYVDGGHIKIEVSKDARAAIAQLEPDTARNIRGGLMSFEEDHLPRIDGAQKAWAARDSYLDKLHGRLEKHAAGLSGVEHHLMKGLLTKGGKRK